MKHPRLILWYAALLPLTVVALTIMCVMLVTATASGIIAVIESLAFRFELWAKYNDPHELLNDPYKETLWQSFMNAFEGR